MLVEAMVGGVAISLIVLGVRTLIRFIRTTVGSWLTTASSTSPETNPSKDPTPSFTVELVRTVLEHQARREDQSRQQMIFLLSQLMSSPVRGDERSLKIVPDILPPLVVEQPASTISNLISSTLR